MYVVLEKGDVDLNSFLRKKFVFYLFVRILTILTLKVMMFQGFTLKLLM